jgi:hypothetical protein
VDPEMFVFVWAEECGAHTPMTRLRARGPPKGSGLTTGERAPKPRREHHPHSLHDPRRRDGRVVHGGGGGLDHKAFVLEAYVEERFLAPSLSPGRVVAMDNDLVGAHIRAGG